MTEVEAPAETNVIPFAEEQESAAAIAEDVYKRQV